MFYIGIESISNGCQVGSIKNSKRKKESDKKWIQTFTTYIYIDITSQLSDIKI